MPIRPLILLFFLCVQPFQDAVAQSAVETGTWRQWSAPPLVSSPGYIAAHDPERHRLLAYFSREQDQGSLWSLSMSGTPKWEPLTLNGPFPSGAAQFNRLYFDTPRKRLVLISVDPSRIWTLANGETVWTELSTRGEPPRAVLLHTAFLDPDHHRLLTLTESGPGIGWPAYELSLDGDPVWRQIATRGELPPSPYHQRAGFDPVHQRILLQGGNNVPAEDTWILGLDGQPPTWSHARAAGPPPERSFRPGPLVYDPVADRFLSFGLDLKSLDLSGEPRWTTLSPSGPSPPARNLHTAVYDGDLQRMIVFGGEAHRDTWALALKGSPAWSSMAGPPSYRVGQSTIHDPVRRRMIVFGGLGRDALNDVWACSIGPDPVWTALDVPGEKPVGRGGHSAVYDSIRDRMIIFGGAGTNPSNQENDTWALSLSEPHRWERLETAGPLPGVRQRHTASFDPVRNRMVLFGGVFAGDYSAAYSRDVWVLALSGEPRWFRLPQTHGGQSDSPTALFEPHRGSMLFFGGHYAVTYPGHPPTTSYGYFNDTMTLSPDSDPVLSILETLGHLPEPRSHHSAVYDSRRRRMLVFGGVPPYTYRNDFLSLNLDASTPAWSTVETFLDGPQSAGHGAIYDPVQPAMWVYKGDGSLWSCEWDDPLVSVVSETVSHDRAELTWRLGQGAPQKVRVYRQAPGAARAFLTEVDADAAGTVALVDSSVRPEAEYVYEVGVTLNFSEIFLGEVRVNIPVHPALLLVIARNPSRERIDLTFSVPTADPARVDLFDAAGRRLRTLEASSGTTGTRSLSVAAGLPSGLYFIRLSQGEHSITRKAVLVR